MQRGCLSINQVLRRRTALSIIAVLLALITAVLVQRTLPRTGLAPEAKCSAPAAAAGSCGEHLPALRATLYYTALEDDYPEGDTAAFRDRDGGVLKRASPQFLSAAEIEGSARFTDGTVLNYASVDGPDIRWFEVDTPYGLDARGCELVPFRSAAVDPDVIPLGTLLFIKETVGMVLPGGAHHDGIWLASDTGNGIVGDRIDLYLGQGLAQMTIPQTHSIDHLQALSVVGLASNQGCVDEAGLSAEEPTQ